MIVKMRKTYIVARHSDRQRLLKRLRELGALHLQPLRPDRAVAEESQVAALDALSRAQQVLDARTAAGPSPRIEPLEAAHETVQIHQRFAERSGRLTTLYRMLEQMEVWGDVRIEQFEELQDAGLDVRFYEVPAEQYDEIRAEVVEPIAEQRGIVLVAAVSRSDAADIRVPQEATPVEMPSRDRPSIRAEAAEIDEEMKADARRLDELAHLVRDIRRERLQMQAAAEFTIAERSGVQIEELYAIQGWVPQDEAEVLGALLREAGVDAAVQLLEPDEDELPPTLVRYPRWARPIQGLFDILATNPGYREHDLSGFFMVALPLFAAFLIGDAGYGLLFTIVPLLFYRRLVAKVGPQKVHLLLIIGICTLIFGVLSANYFGLTPESMAQAGGYMTTVDGREVPDIEAMRQSDSFYGRVGSTMGAAGVLWIPEPTRRLAAGDPQPWTTRDVLIALAFWIGAIHLGLAHLRQVVGYFPDLRWVAEIGWNLVLVGMFGVIWLLFFGGKESYSVLIPPTAIYVLLVAGFVLVVVFGYPSRNPLKRVGVGLASSLLPMMGTFSDTMSYIRLMAVGLATYYIAYSFNRLGADAAEVATWAAGAPIVVFGHLLNIALAVIAVFAHGVRLNMLEFSSNAGVQWAGYPYQPFAERQTKEH